MDEDNQIRYTNLKMITKSQIKEWFLRHKNGETVTQIAKSVKLSHKRMMKLFKISYKFNLHNLNSEEKVIQKCYEMINEKQLLHEKINKV